MFTMLQSSMARSRSSWSTCFVSASIVVLCQSSNNGGPSTSLLARDVVLVQVSHVFNSWTSSNLFCTIRTHYENIIHIHHQCDCLFTQLEDTPSIYMSTWFSVWWRSDPSSAVGHRECRTAPRAVLRPTRGFLLSDLSWEAQGRSPSWFTRQESRLDVKHHDTLTPRGLSISCLRDRVSQH